MVDPAEFVWFTYDEAPPKRALVKFTAVQRAIERCGYKSPPAACHWGGGLGKRFGLLWMRLTLRASTPILST